MEPPVFKVPKQRKLQTFLPPSLVKLVIKIAQKFKLQVYEEFSLLETLQLGIARNANKDFDEKSMCSLLFQIIRTTQKYNSADSQLTKTNLQDHVFGQFLELDESPHDQEFEVLKSLNFKIKSSTLVELIHQTIDEQLPEGEERDFLFSYSIDILRFVYLKRQEIYDTFTSKMSCQATEKLIEDERLLSFAIVLMALKAFNASDRRYNATFDALTDQLSNEASAANLNELTAVIFGCIKKEE